MKNLRFWKLDGAGNDFVALDLRGMPQESGGALSKLVRALCHRQHGIGADGVLILYDAPSGQSVDFAMRYLNADGSVGEMCGNGARCMSVFANSRGAAGNEMVFLTDAGIYRSSLIEGGARVAFPDIEALPEERALEGPLQAGRKVRFLTVGVPHAVIFVDDLESVDVAQTGREIRHDPAFPKGTNVNFVESGREEVLALRTYERGVEAETLACGTGSVASVCAWLHQGGLLGRREVRVIPTGGMGLEVGVVATERGFREITLAGPARIIFEGNYFP